MITGTNIVLLLLLLVMRVKCDQVEGDDAAEAVQRTMHTLCSAPAVFSRANQHF